jgi:hypothetical protein
MAAGRQAKKPAKIGLALFWQKGMLDGTLDCVVEFPTW